MSEVQSTRIASVQRCDTPTIMDGLVVRYTFDHSGRFEVSASRNGVVVSGEYGAVGPDGAGIANLLEVLKWARVQSRHIAKTRDAMPQSAIEELP